MIEPRYFKSLLTSKSNINVPTRVTSAMTSEKRGSDRIEVPKEFPSTNPSSTYIDIPNKANRGSNSTTNINGNKEYKWNYQ